MIESGVDRGHGADQNKLFFFIYSPLLPPAGGVSAPASVRGRSEFIIIFFIKNDKALTDFKKCMKKNFEKFQDSSCWRSIMKKIIVILFMLLPHIEIP